MKRFFISLILIYVVTLLGIKNVSAAGLNDFTIISYDINYNLSKDKENRSVLKTTEKITASFPNIDQNHGIERAVPRSYDGHSVGLKVTAVEDEKGNRLPYTTYESNDNEVIRIGDKDRYVHGIQTYIIRYDQHDVTHFFKDTASDEFYWDTNGTEWKVPIQNLSVSVKVDDTIEQNLNGNSVCYKGIADSNQRCEITKTEEGFHIKAQNLYPLENVTLAIGFEKDTFSPYKESFFEFVARIYKYVLIFSFIASFIILFYLMYLLDRVGQRKKELGTIVAEYTPPKDTSVTVAASIISSSNKTFAAQLIDLAVRHYIKIYEIDKKWIFGAKDYELEIIKDISTLLEEEQEILRDIFSGKTQVGERLKMSSLKNSTSVYMSTLDNDKKLKEMIRGQYGLQEKNPNKSQIFKKMGWIFMAVAILSLNFPLLIISIVAIIIGYTLYVLTDKGLALKRYLEGLKLYIKVAEVERLKMLQSPEGAQKIDNLDTNDPKQLVKLYERTLPYAILFGQEEEWNNQLGRYYESLGGQPEWYSGSNTVFNAAVFSSAMNSFSATSSYTSASSSTSGGSSGGGSSGGGGGGGGGGGW